MEYSYVREHPTYGKCGLLRYAFTVGIVCGIDEFNNYAFRYCYSGELLAKIAYNEFIEGKLDEPREYIKRKGRHPDGRGELVGRANMEEYNRLWNADCRGELNGNN